MRSVEHAERGLVSRGLVSRGLVSDWCQSLNCELMLDN